MIILLSGVMASCSSDKPNDNIDNPQKATASVTIPEEMMSLMSDGWTDCAKRMLEVNCDECGEIHWTAASWMDTKVVKWVCEVCDNKQDRVCVE